MLKPDKRLLSWKASCAPKQIGRLKTKSDKKVN